jgi:hypothetical protein
MKKSTFAIASIHEACDKKTIFYNSLCLIVPTVVEGLEIVWRAYGEVEFILEHGIKKSNMTVYKETKIRPEV